MKSTRILAVVMALAISLLLFASCAAKGIDVNVSMFGPEEALLYNGTVKVTAEPAYAIDATKAAIAAGKLPDLVESEGFISAIAGIESSSTDGWLLYVNGEMAQVGANEQPVTEGDTVEWKYLNYNEAFAQ